MNRKSVKYLLFPVVIFSLLSACGGPTVNVTRIEKPEMELKGVEQVAVADFKDHPKAPGSGSLAASTLISRLKSEGHFRLVERGQIEKVIQEQRLGLAGVVDETTAAEVGKLIGVSAIIVGDVGDYEVEEKRETGIRMTAIHKKRKKNNDKEEEETTMIPMPVFYRHKTGSVTVNYRMVSVNTGEVLVAATKSADFSQKVEEGAQMAWVFRNIFGGPQLMSDGQILSRLLDQVTQQFVAVISPHQVTLRKVLEENDDEDLRRGNRLAASDLWDDAIEVWTGVVERDPDNAGAHYNLGVAWEWKGDLERAIDEYQVAVRLEPDELRFRESLASVRADARLEGGEGGRSETDRAFKIVDREGDELFYADYGSADGALVGQKLIAYRTREVLNPSSGQLLGVDRIDLAEMEVVRVFEHMAALKVVSRLRDEAIGDHCLVRLSDGSR